MKRSIKRWNLKKIFVIAGVAAIVAGLAGCGGTKKDADKTTEINVGYFNNVTHAQALYMKAQGTLDKAFDGKAKVKWTSFNAGPSEVEALFSGDIDIGYIGPVPAISANVKSKGDVSIISGASQAGAELVKAPGSEIESAKDLDGKTVAIPQIGNTQHLCLLKLLSDNVDEPVYFYHCPKLNDCKRCSDYENRPQICRDFPDNPLSILPESCGFYEWRKEVEPIAMMLHAMVEIIDYYKQKIPCKKD